MDDVLKSKPTGKTRLKPTTITSGFWFRKKSEIVLVHQSQVEGFIPQYTGGGHVDGCIQKYWINTKPEWIMENQ